MSKIYRRICNFCGEEYIGHGKHYCSLKCAAKAHRKGEIKNCKVCGKPFYRLHCRQPVGKYCSKKCRAKGMIGFKHSEESKKRIRESRIGPKNPHYKGRFIGSTGYVMLLRRDHPFADCNGHIFEHRVIMEKILGRYLTPFEIVHHKNRIKTDNRPENLQVFVIDNKKQDYKITCPNCFHTFEYISLHNFLCNGPK